MTRTRWSCKPSARSRTVRPSISAAKAASGVMVVAPVSEAFAAQTAETAANDAFACVGLEPIDARRLVRQALPNWEQQAGDDVDRAVGELGNLRHFASPGRGE